jgi:hypothetical protein
LGGVVRGQITGCKCKYAVDIADVAFGKLWKLFDDLHDRIEVAGVPEIFHTYVASTAERFQPLTSLGNGIKLNAHVHVYLKLGHTFLSLRHAHDVDAEVRKVLSEVWVFDHIIFVLGIAENVSAVRCDSAELHDQRVEFAFLTPAFLREKKKKK